MATISIPKTYTIHVARVGEKEEPGGEVSFFLIIIQIIIFCVKFVFALYMLIITQNRRDFKLKFMDVRAVR